MKCPKCKILKNILLLLIFIALQLGNMKGNFIFKKENLNMDEWIDDSNKCFWHILCDMKKPMEIKRAIDLVDDRIVLHVLAICASKLPPHICKEFTLEKARDETFWIEFFQPEACCLSGDDRKRYTEAAQSHFISYGQEICTNFTTEDLCENARKAGKVYNLVQAKMVEEGECTIRHYNPDFEPF